MKQTAVEWLYNALSQFVIHRPTSLAEWEVLKELTEQAKAMESEQMNEIHLDGIEQGYNMRYEQEKKAKQ